MDNIFFFIQVFVSFGVQIEMKCFLFLPSKPILILLLTWVTEKDSEFQQQASHILKENIINGLLIKSKIVSSNCTICFSFLTESIHEVTTVFTFLWKKKEMNKWTLTMFYVTVAVLCLITCIFSMPSFMLHY